MADELTVQVCVVGGGPAGMTLGLELARRGVRVAVLEQSGHFNRSFRGESISPDSVWMLDRLGMLERLRGAYHETRHMQIDDRGRTVFRVDFAQFPYRYPYPVELPQPTLLNALSEEASQYTNFHLLRRTTAVELLRNGSNIVGVRASGPDGQLDVHAHVTVAADGRFSKVRDMAGLQYTKVPMERDFLWLKLPFPKVWDDGTLRVRLNGGNHGLFIPTYPDDLRAGVYIAKGGLKALRAEGIGALHRRLDDLVPELSDSVRAEIKSYSDTSMLEIFTALVPQWSLPGLVLIGDSAHTLSPVLGQGVNHAIIDAITLAPMLAAALDYPKPDAEHLSAVLKHFQRVREPSIVVSRNLQLRQERMFALSKPAGVLARRAVYRLVDSSLTLKRRMLAPAYWQLQERGGDITTAAFPSRTTARV